MGIKPKYFFDLLKKRNIKFFTGVPDSLLKQLCLCIDENITENHHIIAANEGNAVALAAGYHLATGSVPLVYMQNSGLGNAINPLLSLCDQEVYSIPMLLMIGWRGEPGVHDEPQHIKQGKIQPNLLKSMEIPFCIIDKNENDVKSVINHGISVAKAKSLPYAIIVKKDTFGIYKNSIRSAPKNRMKREDALRIILKSLGPKSIVVSTTGKTSREVFEIRENNGQSHHQDFLTVGSMGHCASISLGIAIANPHRKIVCIDGDGSLIMHMGSLATVGKLKPTNFYHILLNNEVHESVGGQATSAKFIDISNLVKANGYKEIYSVKKSDELNSNFEDFFNKTGPNFLEIKITPGSREDLGRPTQSPIKNKELFMDFLK